MEPSSGHVDEEEGVGLVPPNGLEHGGHQQFRVIYGVLNVHGQR